MACAREPSIAAFWDRILGIYLHPNEGRRKLQLLGDATDRLLDDRRELYANLLRGCSASGSMLTSRSGIFAFLDAVGVDEESTLGVASVQPTMVIPINARLPNHTAALVRFLAGRGVMA